MNVPLKVLDNLYFQASGAGNTGYVTVITTTRQYVMTLTAAATNTIQILTAGRLIRVLFSLKCAATGAIELSRSSTTQIATATPDVSVLGRVWIEPVTTSGLPTKDVVLEFT